VRPVAGALVVLSGLLLVGMASPPTAGAQAPTTDPAPGDGNGDGNGNGGVGTTVPAAGDDGAGGSDPPDATTAPGSDDRPSGDPSGGGGTTTTTIATTTTTTVASDTSAHDDPGARRSGPAGRLGEADIPLSSVISAGVLLLVVASVLWVARRRIRPAEQVDAPPAGTPTVGSARDELTFLVELGAALINAGAPTPQVATTLREVSLARGQGEPGLGLLPTSLTVSLRDGDEIRTEVRAVEPAGLRLDQMDAVTSLVAGARARSVDAADGIAELGRIRRSAAPFNNSYVLAGHVLATSGLVLILRGSWRELVLGAVLGLLVGLFIVWSNRISSPAALPFRPLVVAAVCSIAVFAAARVVDGLATFPPLVAPLVTLLPGALLTMGVLELMTGHIVSGASRLASGAMQLLLLGLGIAAGAQLIGYGNEVSGQGTSGVLGAVAPWAGVALFGLGVVWLNGALRSAVGWVLLSLYVAYAGQVIGGLLFGAELSAFFGALAMTVVAILTARRHGAPSPLVTFLPGFWLLVPGALGLRSVSTMLNHAAPTSGASVTTALVAMIGISLGILAGLTLVARDRNRLWLGASGVGAER